MVKKEKIVIGYREGDAFKQDAELEDLYFGLEAQLKRVQAVCKGLKKERCGLRRNLTNAKSGRWGHATQTGRARTRGHWLEQWRVQKKRAEDLQKELNKRDRVILEVFGVAKRLYDGFADDRLLKIVGRDAKRIFGKDARRTEVAYLFKVLERIQKEGGGN